MPVMLAPMAGACPVSLSIAVANAGSMGAMGALMYSPSGIREWVGEFRAGSKGPLQLNTWIPDPPPARDAAGEATRPDFTEQCEAFLELAPTAVSSIMGMFPGSFVTRAKSKGIAWFATA